jgi:hypothetical protein
MTTEGTGPILSGQVYFTPLDPETGEPMGEQRHVGHIVNGEFNVDVPVLHEQNRDPAQASEMDEVWPGIGEMPPAPIYHRTPYGDPQWSTGAHARAAADLAQAMNINAEEAASAMMQMANRLDQTRVQLERARERTRRNRERLEELQARTAPRHQALINTAQWRTRQYLDETPIRHEDDRTCQTSADHVSYYNTGHWKCAKCDAHTCIDKDTVGGDCDHNFKFGTNPVEWHKYRRPQGCEDLP